MDTIETENSEMEYMDLMYFGYDFGGQEAADNKKNQIDFIAEIKQKFPNVKLRNAYDSIKGYRQEVYLEKANEDNYYSWLIAQQWHELSLVLNLIMMSADREPEQKEKFERYFSLAKQQYPELFKSEAL